MSMTIELPDPLVAEINDYAEKAAEAPAAILKQAWDEFRHRHSKTPPAKASPQEIKARIKAMSGTLSLPPDQTHSQLLEAALLEKYGPF